MVNAIGHKIFLIFYNYKIIAQMKIKVQNPAENRYTGEIGIYPIPIRLNIHFLGSLPFYTPFFYFLHFMNSPNLWEIFFLNTESTKILT